MKGLRTIIFILAGISIAALLLSFSFLLQHLSWSYNEEGNHFDEETATNYIDSGIIAWSLLTMLFLVISLVLFFLVGRLKKNYP